VSDYKYIYILLIIENPTGMPHMKIHRERKPVTTKTSVMHQGTETKLVE